MNSHRGPERALFRRYLDDAGMHRSYDAQVGNCRRNVRTQKMMIGIPSKQDPFVRRSDAEGAAPTTIADRRPAKRDIFGGWGPKL